MFGSTGYIGKKVAREMVSRGFNVIAVARERSGIGGGQTAEDVQDMFQGATVKFADVTNMDSLKSKAFDKPVDVVVSCLASRTGGIKDSWDIDYQVRLRHGQVQTREAWQAVQGIIRCVARTDARAMFVQSATLCQLLCTDSNAECLQAGTCLCAPCITAHLHACSDPA